MKVVTQRQVRLIAWIALASFAITFSSCQTCEITKRCSDDDDCPGHAQVCAKPTVRALASDLDALESHIERYGSVVIQHPSVWGQARLTRHREEFEKVMKDGLCGFEASLQGSLSRTDQSYFSSMVALSMAASGQQAMQSQAIAPTNANYQLTPITLPSADLPQAVTLQQNAPRLGDQLKFGDISAKGISLEPSIVLNQKARYLNHLQELRRINEGDDTADSPGYALNLIRVPVSVLPGKHTQEGHGAEVTMTLKPHLGEELLPTTFRNLIVNDLLEQIGVPLTSYLNDREWIALLDYEHIAEKSAKPAPVPAPQPAPPKKDGQPIFKDSDDTQPKKFQPPVTKPKLLDFDDAKVTPAFKQFEVSPSWLRLPQATPEAKYAAIKKRSEEKKVPAIRVPTTKLRHAKRPFPPSQIVEIYGEAETHNVVRIAHETFQHDVPNKFWVHYPDVQGFLQEELAGAYQFLATPDHGILWEQCSPALVAAIHGRNLDTVKAMRKLFADRAYQLSKRHIEKDVTVALAWAIIVESALLNKQLIQDMKESAAAKGCACMVVDGDGAEQWLDFYMPIPSKEARFAFNHYVECRWPVIVFALDPVNEQQNIADTYSARRETQMALSMAFVSGNISAKKMTQYARRLELDMETIALNNTVTGFSHGNETFGWRFYPRYQTPDTESNLKVLVRDQLIGGPNRNALLRQRKLEPGQRECTAIVIMPSFVPYCTLETSSSWFKLTNPKHKDMTCVDAVKLSARVKAIENCSPKVLDANCYRDGELTRLLNRAKQLEARLPLQSAKVQIPYENTLGGFAMFNTGTTDLAPELYGWYGAPGINTTGPTTLFLIGNHFSVHQTRVVVGGVNIESANVELLSRQVMRVTIPAGAVPLDRKTGTFADCPPLGTKPDCTCPEPKKGKNTDTPVAFGTPTAVDDAAGENAPADPKRAKPAPVAHACKELFVHVHVATPYGVTSHMLVPACDAWVCGPGNPPPASVEKCPKPAGTSYCPQDLQCPQDAAKHKKTVDDAKEAREKAAKDFALVNADLKRKKDAADEKAVRDLAKAMTDYSEKSRKEQEEYKKRLEDLEKALKARKTNGQVQNEHEAPAQSSNRPVLDVLPAPAPAPEVGVMPAMRDANVKARSTMGES